ncbi:hypothetical protein P389DRAFT_90691 [Cystobasidium minutum MCA 4210]|uniref:uncharacterized protein n=1 Tax=Cystobasidium minutum MCA 4210 TaxID=1397322 RepID=UPI0034CD81EE|eukprot:jgi/Rhomi1/90691/CE90690_172
MVRFKNRYLLVEFIFDEDAPNGKPSVTEGLLHSIIRDSLAANFGEVGWGQVGTTLTIKYWSQTTGLAIIRTSRPTLPVVWGAITFIRAIKEVGCCARVIHVGGTIRKTQQAAIRYDRELLLAMDGNDATVPVSTRTQFELSKSQQALESLEP